MNILRLLALFTLSIIILSDYSGLFARFVVPNAFRTHLFAILDGLAVISTDFGSEWLKMALVKVFS